MFSLNRLQKAADDLLLKQHNNLLQLIEVDGEAEWEVDDVLTVCKHCNKLQYWIKWLSYNDDPNQYPASNLKYAPYKV